MNYFESLESSYFDGIRGLSGIIQFYIDITSNGKEIEIKDATVFAKVIIKCNITCNTNILCLWQYIREYVYGKMSYAPSDDSDQSGHRPDLSESSLSVARHIEC